MRRSGTIAAPVFLQLIDRSRISEVAQGKLGANFPIKIDLGEGVTECSIHELRKKVDELMSGSTRYGSCVMGDVFDRFHRRPPDNKVRAYEKYVVTGNMRGGYVKMDKTFGPRLTGYTGASARVTLKWVGEE